MGSELLIAGNKYNIDGGMCRIITTAEDENTGKTIVVYQKLFGDFVNIACSSESFLEKLGIKCEAQDVQKTEIPKEKEEQGANPLLLEFLDIDTIKDKIEFLRLKRKEIDDKLITDISISMDLMIEEGDIDKRYRSLLTCLETMAHFECSRLR